MIDVKNPGPADGYGRDRADIESANRGFPSDEEAVEERYRCPVITYHVAAHEMEGQDVPTVTDPSVWTKIPVIDAGLEHVETTAQYASRNA